jgi:hypothetical protein
MKFALAHSSVSADVDSQSWNMPAVESQQKPAAVSCPIKKKQQTSNAARAVVVLSCLAMLYVLVSHGRIFANYLQW